MIFFFLVGLFESEACQNYSVIFARQWNGEDGRFVPPSMLHKASTGIVEVATASAGVERIHGRKKLEYKQ